ncbi:hypothetical protein [Escherichia coli]|uniref:hypothetical protein n=1 Tax=Escherichia coli TaxID=562 RepID=UPI00112F4E44|nr:hypothetical protein [Escherichia coli]
MARTKGAKNRYPAMPAALLQEAIAQLMIAVGKGEQWAIQEALKRIPNAMPEPVPGGVQERVINARIFELQEMEQRLKQLEEAAGVKHENE